MKKGSRLADRTSELLHTLQGRKGRRRKWKKRRREKADFRNWLSTLSSFGTQTFPTSSSSSSSNSLSFFFPPNFYAKRRNWTSWWKRSVGIKMSFFLSCFHNLLDRMRGQPTYQGGRKGGGGRGGGSRITMAVDGSTERERGKIELAVRLP